EKCDDLIAGPLTDHLSSLTLLLSARRDAEKIALNLPMAAALNDTLHEVVGLGRPIDDRLVQAKTKLDAWRGRAQEAQQIVTEATTTHAPECIALSIDRLRGAELDALASHFAEVARLSTALRMLDFEPSSALRDLETGVD